MPLRFVSDGTTAIFMSMLFFVVPSRMPRFGGYGFNEAGEVITVYLSALMMFV